MCRFWQHQHFLGGAIRVALLFPIIILGISCTADNGEGPVLPPSSIEQVIISDQFDFPTLQDVAVEVTVKDFDGNPNEGVRIELFKDPFNNQGLSGELLVSGITNANGLYSTIVTVPGHLQRLFVQANVIGMPNKGVLEISGGRAAYTFEELFEEVSTRTWMDYAPISTPQIFGKGFRLTAGADVDYSFVGQDGQWNNEGVPNWKDDRRRRFSNDFFEDVAEALPEALNIPVRRPNYLADESLYNLVLDRDAEIKINFITEGAGYRNVMGYYTFDPDNPPTSVDQIEAHIVVFPNASLRNDGGGLRAGDQVTIGEFDAGTGLAWFIAADGWNGDVGDGYGLFYSHSNLNPENTADLRKHVVFLRYDDEECIVLGFEDLQRDNGGNHPYYPDHDFNDVIFAVSIDPWNAIDDDYEPPPLPAPRTDADGDGVYDNQDEYPNDAERAFNTWYPSEETFGAMCFEDLWPRTGDYDFNDLVVDYRFKQVTDSRGYIKDVVADFDIKAVGAGFQNGFGFEMPVTPDAVTSVTGRQITANYINSAQNGLEANQTRAVVIVFDNARNLISPASGFDFVNTELNSPEVTTDRITITILMDEPTNFAADRDNFPHISPPYNPFLIVDQTRGREIHMADYSPTDLVDANLFGTGDDSSNPNNARYYKTPLNLPWALLVPSIWQHCIERNQIITGYPHFVDWAESDGNSYQNWYLDEGDNIDWNYIWRPGN